MGFYVIKYPSFIEVTKKEELEIARVILKENIKSRIKNGHPWIFENEIQKVEGDFQDGDIVDVFYHSHDFVGKGYINSKSKIRVRLLTRRNEKIGKEFFKRRIKEIVYIKKSLLDDLEAFRVVFSDADGLPGLIVDKYGSYLVIQIGTLGMEKFKGFILDALIEIFHPKGIYEKSDFPARKREGLNSFTGWIYGSGPELIEFNLNGMYFVADTKGQKTGAFLDQKYNALLLEKIASDKNVLDVFSYTGNFSLHALRFGAKHVALVDYSQRSLDVAKIILDKNGFSGKYTLVNTNAFDELRKLYKEGVKDYDMIILDPPAFAKSFEERKDAYRGYKEINLRSMKLLKKPGILVTSSCSRVVSEQDFLIVLYDAASDAKMTLKMLKKGSQPPDHAPVLNIFETFYLKFFIFHVTPIK